MSQKKYRLPKKRKSVVPDPTPEEIEARCKEIQAGWDEETRLARIVDRKLLPSPHEWTPPVISTSDIAKDFLPDGEDWDDMVDNYSEPDEDLEEFLEEIIVKEKK